MQQVCPRYLHVEDVWLTGLLREKMSFLPVDTRWQARQMLETTFFQTKDCSSSLWSILKPTKTFKSLLMPRNWILNHQMDERAKSKIFVDVKDSAKYSENILVERTYESKHILFRRPTFGIMSLPSRFQEMGSTRLEQIFSTFFTRI